MSDIHGHYTEFKKMLNEINFTKDDTLYILGDIVDRGFENVKMIKYVMSHENIHMLLGNHEDMLLNCYFAKNVMDKAYNENIWFSNGGYTTKDELDHLPKEELEECLSFLQSLPRYLFINNDTILLVHAGIFPKNTTSITELMKNQEDDCVWIRGEFFNSEKEYPFTIIFGHTPTSILPELCYLFPKSEFEKSEQSKIVKWKNRIAIDCGCAYNENLSCLRLDDMKEFYLSV